MHFQTSGHLPALRDLIHQADISTRLIIVAEILGGIRGVAQHIDGIALQQCADLRLVIRGDIIRLRYWLGENGTIALIGALGADEDAHTMLRLGIEIPDVTATEVMNHEAMRWQRVQRLRRSFSHLVCAESA